MLNRRSVLKAGAATVTVAAPAAAHSAADDARLFDLLRQLGKAKRAAQAASAREREVLAAAPVDVMGIRWWTKDELTAYGIDGKKTPRFVSLEELAKNAIISHPGESEVTVEVVQKDSKAFIQLVKTNFPQYTADDLARWKQLCADREALYHAKEQAYDEARRIYGFDAAMDAVDEAWREYGRIYALVVDMPANTPAGILAKLKFYMVEEELIDPETPPDKLGGSERLFLSVVDALERIGGAA